MKRAIFYRSQLFLICIIILSFGLLSNAIDCTESDYEAQYTQCRPDQYHDLIWYKKKDVNCTGGASPPDAIFDLPCDINCDDGYYLPLGSLTCSPCTPGTYSRGGGRIANEWSSWPTDMGIWSTFCVSNFNPNTPIDCAGWRLDGRVVRSGNITHSQTSILQLQVQLLTPGHVRFSYKVDAEINYDGLYFKIDGNATIRKQSLTTDYVDYIANISAGYHVLRWEYLKDVSISQGDDAVFLRSVEISGLTYAESSCTPCPPGSYASGDAATGCLACPAGTAASDEGTAVCPTCPAGHFSYIGDLYCREQAPCTTDDYQYLYGTCASGSRTATADWLQPKICNDATLPLPDPVPSSCPSCPAGTAPDSNSNCVVCPSGSASTGGGAPCDVCGAGNSATKALNITSFDQWQPGQSTSCSGSCGSSGWRLRSNYIDSGSGHGDHVNSLLQYNVTLEQKGFISFAFVLNCSRACGLSFIDYPYSPSVSWDTMRSGRNIYLTYTTALDAGDHQFIWTFIKDIYQSEGEEREDAVKLFHIYLNGTTIGGAASCTPCKTGTYSEPSHSLCSNCSAGSTNSPDKSTCVGCADNTFSYIPGDICRECGATTTANPTHTDCIDTCTFTIDGELYDISELAKSGPFGPITHDIYSYYINLCGRGGFNADCVDDDGNNLTSHVCQVLPYGYALDVGWLPAYYSLDDIENPYGFRVHYDLGVLGCGPYNGGTPLPRNSELKFICDASAGTGSLSSPDPLESPPCHYNFIWRSLYACPICTANHYSFYYSPCIQGQRQKVYYWNDPKTCHAGVSLPAPEQVGCSDSVFECGIGEYLGADGASCVPCDSGDYSVGGGLLISNWPPATEPLPYSYISVCDSFPCSPWVSDDGLSIHSDFGDTSLVADHSFRRSGSISFKFKLYSPVTGIFRFYIDGIERVELTSSIFEWTTLHYDVGAGPHTFKWQFVNGLRFNPSLLIFQGVAITDILLIGLDYHADACNPCPAGTYSSGDNTTIGCPICPANTFSTGQVSSCTACDPDYYSLPGASYCLPRPPCFNYSYEAVYAPCGSDGSRLLTYKKTIPDMCIGGYQPPAPMPVPCAPCPPYTFRQESGECVGCPAGQYFRDGECVDNIPGYIVQRSQLYFNDNSLSEIPANFYTGCSGLCGSPGWRVGNARIDSGYHGTHTVDSYIGFKAVFSVDGSISFTYSQRINGTTSGLQLLVDGVVIPIPTPFNNSLSQVVQNIPISQGQHNILWNFHQENGHGFALLHDLLVVGMEGAIAASEGLPCEAGTFSSDPTALACSPCDPGTYTGSAGSVACYPCAKDTYNPVSGANECRACELGSYTNQTGSTQCVTDCHFKYNGDVYDLKGTNTMTVYDDERRKYLINVCNTLGGSQCANSHVCLVDIDGTSKSGGDSFRFAPNDANSTAQPYSIYFEYGSSTGCDGGRQRTTYIDFECDPDTPDNVPIFDQEIDCVVQFTWQTIYACPVCTEDDYQIVRGVCSGGNRQISKSRIHYCNGPATIDVPDEGCSSSEFPLGAILAVIFVFLAVVAVAAFIFFRNRRLSQRYAALVEETKSVGSLNSL